MSANFGRGRGQGLKRRRLLQAGLAVSAWGATGAAAEDAPPDSDDFAEAHGKDPRIAVSESSRALLDVLKRFWERINGTVVAMGSGNAYVYATANKSLPLAYVQGEAYSFKAGFTNGAAATLNINGLGAKPLYKQSIAGPSALAAGDIRRGQFVTVMYDAALNGGGGGFQIVSQISDATISRFYATVAELKAVEAERVPAGFVVHVAGYHAAGDGGGGQFWFDAVSTADDDGGLVLAPAGKLPAGRWMRFAAGLRLSPKWFGAKADGKTPAAAQLQATLDAAKALYVVDIDDTYLVDATLILRHGGQVIAGQGTLKGAIAAFPRIFGNAPFGIDDSHGGEGSFLIKSLAAKGDEITATTLLPHSFKNGDTVAVFFVLPDSYCGIQPVTVTGPQSFTYRVPQAPEGPAQLHGALSAKIDHPPVTAPNDPLAASGGACFHASGNIDNVLVKDIHIAEFRYAALMSGPGLKDPATVDSVNMLTFERVTFQTVNICGFGYPFIQGGTFLDCIYYEVNCIACGNAVCVPAGHPYAGTDTQFVVLLAIENRRGLEHRLRVNANLDLWFYESVLRPETPSINPQKTPTWFPFPRGKNKMPPSQAAVSGHGVYCPSRSAAQQYENTIRNFKTFCNYRSLVVMGQPSFLMMDCIGTETYLKVMPGEPTVHIILAYEDNGIIPLGRDGVLRRIENLEFQNPASKSIEIDRIRYDQSGFVARAGGPDWLGGDTPHGILSFDCETPNDCLVQWNDGTSMNQAFVVTPQTLAAAPAAKGASVVGNAVHPLTTGLSELGIHRSSGSFLLGSTALGSSGNRLQLCGSQERATRGIMEILATRLDTGESDYCRLRFTLPPHLEAGPAGLGTLAADLDIGNASVALNPGSKSKVALQPGLALEIGANRLVVQSYDDKSRTLTFHSGAQARAPAGTGLSAPGELKIVDPFAGAIFESPYVNGTAIELRTTLYPDGAPAPVPIAVTFWSTDTLYFEGGGTMPR